MNDDLYLRGHLRSLLGSLTVIQILHPSVLILTKLKRWAMNCDSTRPKTVQKSDSDKFDLDFMIFWLHDKELLIDFDSYIGKTKPALLSYVGKYREHYGADELLMEALRSILQVEDWDATAPLSAQITTPSAPSTQEMPTVAYRGSYCRGTRIVWCVTCHRSFIHAKSIQVWPATGPVSRSRPTEFCCFRYPVATLAPIMSLLHLTVIPRD